MLKLGAMKNIELAEWFGITPKTFSNYKNTYLQKLEPFAKFTKIRGGVVIEEIYIPEYVKNLDNDVQIYLNEVKEAEDHITSLSGMGQKLSMTEEFNSVKLSTIISRMTRAGKKAFGITADSTSRGIYGRREYAWVIKLYDRPNHYRYMTVEETARLDNIISIFYSQEPEKVRKAALLEETFRASDDMTKEEYFEQKERLNVTLFSDVIKQFKVETGLQMVHATAHSIDVAYLDSAF